MSHSLGLRSPTLQLIGEQFALRVRWGSGSSHQNGDLPRARAVQTLAIQTPHVCCLFPLILVLKPNLNMCVAGKILPPKLYLHLRRLFLYSQTVRYRKAHKKKKLEQTMSKTTQLWPNFLPFLLSSHCSCY